MTVSGWPPPASTGAGQSWDLGDTQRLIRTGQANSAGAGTVTFPQVDAGRRLEIVRAVVSCTGIIAPPPSCRLYVVPAGTSPAPQYEVSGTGAGLFDEADYAGDGLWVVEGEQLLAVWTGAPVNASLAVNLQTRLMVQSS